MFCLKRCADALEVIETPVAMGPLFKTEYFNEFKLQRETLFKTEYFNDSSFRERERGREKTMVESLAMK